MSYDGCVTYGREWMVYWNEGQLEPILNYKDNDDDNEEMNYKCSVFKYPKAEFF